MARIDDLRANRNRTAGENAELRALEEAPRDYSRYDQNDQNYRGNPGGEARNPVQQDLRLMELRQKTNRTAAEDRELEVLERGPVDPIPEPVLTPEHAEFNKIVAGLRAKIAEMQLRPSEIAKWNATCDQLEAKSGFPSHEWANRGRP